MKFLEMVVITVPAVIMGAIVIFVITDSTINDFEIYVAVIISGLVSLGIAYYFHKKDTPAQTTWNEKRKETMGDMLDLFEQLSRNVRTGDNMFKKVLEKSEHSKQLAELFVSKNQKSLNKITHLNNLIHQITERNYNYLTNKEARIFKMNSDTIKQYLLMKIWRKPENYLDEIKFLDNKRTMTKQLSKMFVEVNSANKEFLERGIFKFHESDLDPRWENIHKY